MSKCAPKPSDEALPTAPGTVVETDWQGLYTLHRDGMWYGKDGRGASADDLRSHGPRVFSMPVSPGILSSCARCGAQGHDAATCTPPPCPGCGGVEAHVSDSCPAYQRMAYVRP